MLVYMQKTRKSAMMTKTAPNDARCVLWALFRLHGLALAVVSFFLAAVGLHWPLLAAVGLHWPSLAAVGLHWPSLAAVGLHWPSLAAVGLHSPLLAAVGCHCGPL